MCILPSIIMFTLGLEFLFKVWFYYRSFSDFLGKTQQHIPKKTVQMKRDSPTNEMP